MAIPKQERGERFSCLATLNVFFFSLMLLDSFNLKANIFLFYSVKKDGSSNPEADDNANATKNCTEGMFMFSKLTDDLANYYYICMHNLKPIY